MNEDILWDESLAVHEPMTLLQNEDSSPQPDNGGIGFPQAEG